MLLRNDLLYYAQPHPHTVRILWIAADRGRACIFDVAATSADVRQLPMRTLDDDLASGRAQRLPSDPYLVVPAEETLPDKHLLLRARAWAIVEPLTRQEPDIYDPHRRGQLIAECTALHGVSHPTVYRYLRRYWQRGQTPNALLPDYANSGARGKVRAASAGVKRGRPRKDGADPGVNVDDDIRRVFRVATARFAADHTVFSRRGAYQQMLNDFFGGRRIDYAAGRVQESTTPVQGAAVASMLPTMGQFSYWLEQDGGQLAGVRHRSGRHTSTTAATVITAAAADAMAERRDVPFVLPEGRPGDAYYLDAVRADVLLVSRADRAQLVGRPLLYVAIDRFSGMVTGLSISLAAQCGQEAILALANSAADKQRYCRQYGRDIDAGQWPCQHLPASLLVPPVLAPDWNGDALLNNFSVRCYPTHTVPDAWKAVLERRFRLVAPDAGGDGSRLDGVLDLEQFSRMAIDSVIDYNNARAGAPPASTARAGATQQWPGMSADVAANAAANASQPLSPAALWLRGAAERGVAVRPHAEQLVRCCLLPRALATVTAQGIRLHGNDYTCARAVEERWFERARLRGQWSVMVAYDPANLDMLYLPDPAAAQHFHACHLLERSLAQGHLSAVEIDLYHRRRQYLRERIEQATADDLRRNVGLRLAYISG